MQSLRDLLRPRQLQLLLTTGLTRALGALGGLALSFLVGRYLGSAGLGAFAFAHAVCLVAAVVSRRGYDSVLMRAVSRSLAVGLPGPAREALRFALTGVTRLALWVTVGVGFFVWLNPTGAMDPGARLLLGIMSGAILPLTLLMQFSGFFKGLHRASLGIMLESGGVSLAATAILFLAVMAGLAPSLTLLGVSFLLGGLVLVLIAVLFYASWVRDLPDPDRNRDDEPFDLKAFGAAGTEFLAISLGVYMMQAGSFLFAGLMLSSEDVGLLKAAERLTMAINFWPAVVNPIVAPRIAALYQRKEHVAIGGAARRASLFCLLASLPFALLLFSAPRFSLELFGPEFGEGVGFLRIMVVGHFIAVALDPSFHVLTMSRHENLVRSITLILLGVSVVGYPAMMLLFGAYGFAVASALLVVSKNVAIVVFTWRRMRLWTIPGPNLGPWITGSRKRRDR